MMNTRVNHTRRLLVLMFLAAALLVGATPAATARATEPAPTWMAVAITVDFTLTPWRVGYTLYAGKNNPATVLKWAHRDITGTCVVDGTLGVPDANGYMSFNGATRIRCQAPGMAALWAELYPNRPGLPPQLTCPCRDGGPTNSFGPLYASADARVVQSVLGTVQNPVIAAPDLGITYSLPVMNGTQSRSRIELNPGITIDSSVWSANNAGNQVLLGGINGPAIIAADTQFGWLGYLNSSWKTPFASVFGPELRHWYQAPNTLTNVTPVPTSYQLSTSPHQVYIGFNPTTNQYLRGSLRKGVVDPGCPAS